MLPEEAAGDELSGQQREDEHVEDELEQAQTPDLRLCSRVWLLGAHLLPPREPRRPLLRASAPRRVLRLAFGTILGIARRADRDTLHRERGC